MERRSKQEGKNSSVLFNEQCKALDPKDDIPASEFNPDTLKSLGIEKGGVVFFKGSRRLKRRSPH